MRKVLIKEWVPIEHDKETKRQIPGTGTWSKDFTGEGLFHQWAAAYEESSAGFGNYTVALVEMPDGTIREIYPVNVKFV